MSDNKLIIRTKKNIFMKSKRYLIKVNGTCGGEINYENNKIEYELPIGNYEIEIENGLKSHKHKLNFTIGQIKTLIINPSVTYELFLGLLLGIAFTAVIIQIFLIDKISLPLMFIPFLPLLLIRKSQFPDKFVITTSK
jgi:hypothetical protein